MPKALIIGAEGIDGLTVSVATDVNGKPESVKIGIEGGEAKTIPVRMSCCRSPGYCRGLVILAGPDGNIHKLSVYICPGAIRQCLEQDGES